MSRVESKRLEIRLCSNLMALVNEYPTALMLGLYSVYPDDLNGLKPVGVLVDRRASSSVVLLVLRRLDVPGHVVQREISRFYTSDQECVWKG